MRCGGRNNCILLIDKKNQIAYDKIKNNIVGGPSIIFHRYHEKDKTKIQKIHYFGINQWGYYADGKVVKRIIGYDANALYLYCMMQKMPCGKLVNIDVTGLNYGRIWEHIWDENSIGAAEVDIEVPEQYWQYFCEFPPFFIKLEYTPNDVYSKHIANKLDLKLKPEKKLVSVFEAKKILLLTPVLRWYLKHGCVIKNFYSYICPVDNDSMPELGNGKSVFTAFTDYVIKKLDKQQRKMIH